MKSPASSHLAWLYSPVYVGPGRNPEERFSQNAAHFSLYLNDKKSLYMYCCQILEHVEGANAGVCGPLRGG